MTKKYQQSLNQDIGTSKIHATTSFCQCEDLSIIEYKYYLAIISDEVHSMTRIHRRRTEKTFFNPHVEFYVLLIFDGSSKRKFTNNGTSSEVNIRTTIKHEPMFRMFLLGASVVYW